MAGTRKTPKAAAKAAPREAHSLGDASEIGLFGVEVDATDDSEYAAPGAGSGPNSVPLLEDAKEDDK